MKTHPRLVVIGNGMAGMRTVEELLKLAPDMYRITVFGAEPHGNYNRILLSPVLAGEKTVDDIMLNTREWYDANGITLHAGDPVMRIDRKKRVVHAASGLAVPYDRLLIATGSKPFIVPVPGHQLPGVIGFRDISDVDTMLEAARAGGKAVVTQLFFDNADFYRFRDDAERAGIKAPIVAGIMPIQNVSQIKRFIGMCGAKIPHALLLKLEAIEDDADAVYAAGVDHATEQCADLLKNGAAGLHYYTLNKSKATADIAKRLNFDHAY